MSENDMFAVLLQKITQQDTVLSAIQQSQTDIKLQLSETTSKLDTHVEMEEALHPSVKELLDVFHGSKVISRIVLFIVTIIGAGWSGFQWAKDHIK